MTPRPHTMTRGMVLLFAISSAISVANLYYNQPLLAEIGRSFGQSASSMGLIPTLTQLGYAAGLLLITPLGDVLPRRPLVVALSVLTAAASAATALSSALSALIIASFLLGGFTVVPQILIPLAADLAEDERRGQVVGTVMSGVLIGILAARIVSGVVAGAEGWRAVFWLGAGLMLVLAIAMRLLLPDIRPHAHAPYGRVLLSLVQLVREQPLLRQSAVIGAMAFGAFSVLWSVLSFLLSAAPYHYGSAIIGLFGLVGIAGASAAPFAGRMADRRGPYVMVGIGMLATGAAFVVLMQGADVLATLILGILVLDFGVQSTQISNQARIYSLGAHARSRINSVYMVSYFLGGALGSSAGAVAYDHGGFKLSCAVALVLVAIGLIAHVARRPTKSVDLQDASGQSDRDAMVND